MKETSPEAYNCVAACADQSTQEAAAGCTFACVLSDPKLKEAEKKQEDAAKDASSAGSKELEKVLDQPVKPIKGKMKTFDDKPFSFSLSLAEGFTEDASMATDTIRSWDVKIPGLLTGPNVTIMPTLAPDFERDVKQAAELKETVALSIAFIEAAGAAAFNGAETRRVELRFPGVELNFEGQGYLTSFALPNFYFHLSMAYAILRHLGVPLGKRDFLGQLELI